MSHLLKLGTETIIVALALCATITHSEANTGSLEDVSRTVIGKGELEPPSDLVGLPQLIEVADDSPRAANTDSRYDLFADVMNLPGGKGKFVARLKNGQSVKVLQAKKNWLKISWDESRNQGWLKKSFVEGNIIHAHR